MARAAQPTTIKRYANRRLYDTSTGRYVSRKTLEAMAQRGEVFVVLDTVTSEDITHSVLGQIIVAQEAKQDHPLLPTEFMRRVIGFYGDGLRTVLACYLDFSLLTLTNETVRQRMTEAGSSAIRLMEEQAQQNIKFVEMILFNLTPRQPEAKERKNDPKA
ncbi:MAG: polyhydroxyalkanoate synthesis repressor PhaR [Xanthobacteraceae bacterium]|nr:polyhydroxyalkanoate synthesis repressor PhaR [Xanthobacteraceae bacterium]MBV9239969.1 polyhydroxyalkanoate synthesis repressor PhaR [Xanthobacteraceae bacterium]MBV9631373.1 polyhydroxyalkanoate synthesis repressor PhaR [Xanthobacteraceae bacterium]